MFEICKLRNGTEEAKPLVIMTMLSLEHLLEDHPLVFYDLVMKCRNRDYEYFGDAEQTLKTAGLLDVSGSIHQSIKNIVLSAADGDGIDMTLINPIV